MLKTTLHNKGNNNYKYRPNKTAAILCKTETVRNANSKMKY